MENYLKSDYMQCDNDDLKASGNNETNSVLTLNYIRLFKIQSTFKIDNQSSLLFIKVNPQIPNDFVIVDSSFNIHYFSMKGDEIYKNLTFSEHKERIHDICFFDRPEENYKKVFFSASSDGTVKLWDANTSTSSIHTINIGGGSKKELFSINIFDNCLLVGSDSLLFSYDVKAMKLLNGCDTAHSGDVTSVKYMRTGQHAGKYVITTGEDGLINIYNLEDSQKGLSEDEVVTMINTNVPLLSANFIDNKGLYIDFVTSENTYSVFDVDQHKAFIEFDAKNAGYNTNYIIDRYYDESNGLIELYCGNNDNGDLSFLKINLNTKEIQASYLPTNSTQFFNGITRLRENNFIAVSDEGMIIHIVLDKEKVNQAKPDMMLIEEPVEEFEDLEENKKKKNGKNNKYNPY